MIQALIDHHHVETLTLDRWPVGDTNAFYGTSIPARIEQHTATIPWRWLAHLPHDQLTRLRLCSVLREARRLASDFDLLITADNYAPFARPGIQYVHFPAELQPPPARMTALVHVYFRLCDRVLGAPWIDAAKNITLANSQWTARELEHLGEVSTPIVLYPPVIDPGAGLSWHQRDDLFLCIGRFHGSKRIEMAVSIVQRIRERVLPGARLIIIGSPVDAEYTTRIHGIASRAGDWIEFREDVSRSDLNALMGRSRYGIQAMENEHFGMATVEMIRAGCIVFAHNSGGSPEVLNNEDSVLWTTEDEAVEKFARLDAVPLRTRLRQHAQSFSVERFVDQFRSIVATSTAGSRDR